MFSQDFNLSETAAECTSELQCKAMFIHTNLSFLHITDFSWLYLYIFFILSLSQIYIRTNLSFLHITKCTFLAKLIAHLWQNLLHICSKTNCIFVSKHEYGRHASQFDSVMTIEKSRILFWLEYLICEEDENDFSLSKGPWVRSNMCPLIVCLLVREQSRQQSRKHSHECCLDCCLDCSLECSLDCYRVLSRLLSRVNCIDTHWQGLSWHCINGLSENLKKVACLLDIW